MTKKSSILLVMTSILFISDLHGYIDPGSGSFILQLLIAGLVSVLYAVKVFWKQIKMSLTRLVNLKSK